MVNKPKVTVIGSANIDLVIRTHKYPQLGETTLGESLHQFPGGKGANQAVAAARLGGDVAFIGCIGDDEYGKQVIRSFESERVKTNYILQKEKTRTGVAQIIVTEEDNLIIVVPGANSKLNSEYVKKQEKVIKESDVIILQLEIPLEAVSTSVEIAYENNVPIILNPAPAQLLPVDLLRKITYITPNKSEIEILTSIEIKKDKDIQQAFKILYERGVENVILTLGEKGVVYGNCYTKQLTYIDSYPVNLVDTTGAGDAFNAALAISIAKDLSISDGIDYSNRVAALSITKLGAQSGMPTAEEVSLFSKNNSNENIRGIK